ncbi:aminoglycoside phosphotransferase family protein [Cytobacillus sp. FSL R5-0596]|uniref:aminoglycoside phosphotransferase family protein n=1 Tax=Cytobacillus sp. FSL R5-0596 TaxID=2954696 RepID=UPI0030F83C20
MLFEKRQVFKEHLPPLEHIHEANKQEYAFSCGLPVPKIVKAAEIEGRQAIIMKYVKGNKMESPDHYLTICAQMQQKIDAMPADPSVIGSMTDRLYKQIQIVETLNQEQKIILLKKLDSMMSDSKLFHGDFHPFNIIIGESTVTVIDWVVSSSGDVLADVTRTYLLISEASAKLAKRYVHIYSSLTGISREEIFHWIPIIAAARLSENVSEGEHKRLLDIIKEFI